MLQQQQQSLYLSFSSLFSYADESVESPDDFIFFSLVASVLYSLNISYLFLSTSPRQNLCFVLIYEVCLL